VSSLLEGWQTDTASQVTCNKETMFPSAHGEEEWEQEPPSSCLPAWSLIRILCPCDRALVLVPHSMTQHVARHQHALGL
jgi:hypothetical protein